MIPRTATFQGSKIIFYISGVQISWNKVVFYRLDFSDFFFFLCLVDTVFESKNRSPPDGTVKLSVDGVDQNLVVDLDLEKTAKIWWSTNMAQPKNT